MILGSKRAVQKSYDYGQPTKLEKRLSRDYMDDQREKARKRYDQYVQDLDVIDFESSILDPSNSVKELSEPTTARLRREQEQNPNLRNAFTENDRAALASPRNSGRANDFGYEMQHEIVPRTYEAPQDYFDAVDNRSQYRTSATQAPSVSNSAAASRNELGHAGRDRFYRHMRQAELQDLMEPTTDYQQNLRNNNALAEAKRDGAPDYSEYLNWSPTEFEPMSEAGYRNSQYWHGYDNENLDLQTAYEEHRDAWEQEQKRGQVNNYLANYQKDLAEGNAEQYQLKADEMKTAIDKPVEEWDSSLNLFENLSNMASSFEGPQAITRFTNPELYQARTYADNALSDEERDVYRYIVGKYGLAAGNDYLESINEDLESRVTEAAAESYEKIAEEHPVVGALSNTALSLSTAPMSYLGLARNALGDEKISENDPSLRGARFTESTQRGTQQGIWNELTDDSGWFRNSDTEGGLVHIDKDSDFARSASDFLVGTALSTAQSTVAGLLMPEAAVLAMFSGNAAGSSLLKSSRDENVSKNQATALAAAEGAMESFFEKFSLENMNSMRHAPATSGKNIIKNWLKSSFVEGTEEFFTDVTDNVWDLLINGENSEAGKEYSERLANDEEHSPMKAFLGTVGSVMKDALLSAAGGALSGGVTTLAANTAGHIDNRTSANRALKGSDLRQVAENLRKDGDSYQSSDAKIEASQAAEMADDLASRERLGEKITGADYQALYNQMQQAAADEQQAINQNNDAGNDTESEEEAREREIEQYYTGGKDIDADRAIRAMAKAKTPNELVEIRDYGRHTLNPMVKNLIDTAYSNYRGKMISSNKNTYKESDFQAAESMSVADAFRMGRNGDSLPQNATDAQKRAFLSGRGVELSSENRATLPEDTSKTEAKVLSTGASAIITGIDHVDITRTSDGPVRDVFAKTSDGKTVNLKDIQAMDPAMRHTFRNIQRLPSAEAMNAYLENAPKNMPVGQYANEFRKYYVQGSMGKADFDDVFKSDNSAAKQWFTGDGKDKLKAIFELGQSERNAELLKQAAEQDKTVVRKGKGKVTASEGVSKGIVNLVQAVADRTGIDINLGSDFNKQINGQFIRGLQQASLNVGKEDKFLNSLFHETVGEFMQAFNAKGMNEVQDAILDYLVESEGIEDFTESVGRYQSSYTDVEGTKTFTDAMNEMVNDSIAGLFSTDEGIKDFTEWLGQTNPNSQKTILQKAADFFKQIADTIRNLINRSRFTGASLDTAQMAEERAREIRQKILQEMDTAIQNAASAQVGNDSENAARNSIDVGTVVDNQGRSLSKAQQDYFRNSKVVDENGNLLTVYHGTGAEFYEFDRNRIGSNGSFEGAGFNFTPSEIRASGYKNIGGDKARVLEGYLNIENPLSDTSKTMSPARLAQIIRDIDPTGDDIISNYARDTRDYGTPQFIRRESMNTARQILDFAESDVDVYSELSAAGADANTIIDAYKGFGYDGLIHHTDDGKIKTLIAFDSNQFKLADNMNPTEDMDIRYSVAVDEDMAAFIDRVQKNGGKYYENYVISDSVKGDLADAVKQLTGIDVEGWTNNIGANSIRHILKDHGPNGAADHSMADINDIARAGFAVENFGKAWLGDKTSGQFRNSDHSNAKVVILQTKIGDGFYYIAEAVPDSPRKRLVIQSTYINKRDISPERSNADSPAVYVRNAVRDNVSSDITLPQAPKNGNTLSKERQSVDTEERQNKLDKIPNKEYDQDGNLQIAHDDKSGTVVFNIPEGRHSLETLANTKRKLRQVMEERGYDPSDISRALESLDMQAEMLQEIAKVYPEMEEALHADIITDVTGGKQVLRSFIKNGEYPVNVDFMTICKKRQAYMRVLTDLIDDGTFARVAFKPEAIAAVNNILRDNEYETACLGCFVESRRLQIQKWAESFCDAWNKQVKEAAGRNATPFRFGKEAKGGNSLSADEILRLQDEYSKAGKKNSKGNLNLGQGTVESKMARLLERIPSLAHTLEPGDIIKTNGIANLRRHYGDIYSLLLQWYGSNTPKVNQDFNPYNGEFSDLNYAFMKTATGETLGGGKQYKNWAKNQIRNEKGPNYKVTRNEIEDLAIQKYLYDIGGARLQSFSDFLIENTLDYFQMVGDLAAKKLPMHAYSKEISFIRIFGMTGLKANMSLIPVINRAAGRDMAGLNPDGSYAGWGDYEHHIMMRGQSFIQSIGFKDALALQLDPRYSKNIGTIAIGVSDKHIMKMLDDSKIRMIIPYHRSGMSPAFAKLMDIDAYTDYTDDQNTTVKQYYDLDGNPVQGFDGKIKCDTVYNYNEAAQRLGDARKAADEYKQWCSERHPVYRDGKKIGEATFRPKFEKFSTHDNYYKLLEDFNMYDAITEESAPQTAVEMRYPDVNNKLTAKELSDYKERLRETGEFSEEEIEKYAKKAQMSLEEIIRKEATDRNKYHREADAKYDSTLKEIEGMLKDKYPRDEYDISGLEVRNAVDLDDFWFGEDSDANLASVEDEYYRPAASIMEEGAKALAEEQVDTAAIRRIATEIKREYGSNYSTNDLIDNLEKVFAYAQSNNDSISYDNLMSVLAEVAQPVIDESTQKVGDEEYQSFMNAMKGYKIALTERQKDEVISAFGSYQEFRRAMRGINISNNGTTLDRIWLELNELVPGMLDEDTSEGDMPLALYDAMTALEPTVKNSYGADSKEVARNLALEIVEKYFEQAGARAGNEKAREAARRASQKAKEAGKQYKEQLRKRYNERIAKAREDLGKRYSQMTREQRERFQEKARKLRETHKQDIAEIRARNRQQAINRRAMQDANYEKQMIDRRARKMATWLRSPSDTKHVPKALQRTVESLVGAIDLVTPHVVRNPEGSWTVQVIERYDPEGFSVTRPETFSSRAAAVQAYRDSYRQSKQDPNYRRWTERMSDLRDMYNRAARGEEEDANGTIGDFLHMLDTSLTESFSDLIKRGAAVEDVSDLGADDLRTLNRVLANVEHAVNQINKAYSSNAEISALAQDTIQNSKKYKGRGNHSRVVNSTIDFLTIHNATPETFFHTLGKGGEQIYKMLRKGLNQRARDIRRANEYTLGENGILKGIDISKWSGRKVKPTEYKLQSGESVYMTPAQVMSLYELSKRQQAMFHQTGGFSVEKQLINGKEVRQRYKHFTDFDVKRITDTLSDEQKRVADDLQKFLARDCAEWGNETSNKLYGYDKFGDPNYYPISTDKEVVATQNKDVATNSINAIKNMGFTKEVKPNAQNPIVIRDIFDVFTGHVTDMAAYHSYAAPITDLLRWYNYAEKDVDKKTGFADYTTTKGAIADLTGSRGGNYVTTLLSGLNNMERSNYFGGPTELLMGHFKAAAIAGNMRVVIQQPTAYFRAGNVISYKWLTEALAASKKTKDDAKRMQDETSDISWWKSQGYWETGIGKSLKNIITGDQTAAEKFTEATMAPAGKADDITWGVLYRAVYMEQKDRFLKNGKATDTDEFRDAVNDRFDEVIDRTQVVDSTLHRSQFMRATDPLSKTQTAFMAEPTKNLNMFIRAHADAVKSYQDNGGKISRDTYRNLVRAGAAVTITAVVNAAAQSIIDALRHHSDDKDYIEQWLEEWRANFINNMNPLDWIPILKDLGGFGDIIKAAVTGENYNMFSGSDSSRMDMAVLNQAAQAFYRTAQYARGKGSYTLYGVVKQNVRALSQLAGMPFYNLMRDAEALYNTLNDRSGLPDLISKTSGSKNAKLFEAIDSGKAVEDTIAKEVDGGRTIKDIQSAISSHYKSDYYDYYEAEDDRYEDIGDKAAEAFKATGMTDEEVATLLEEWRNPSLSYNMLDGAIDGSGDDIGQMISDLRDADKTPESIKGHLVSRYASTLRYNEGRGLTDEELNANLAQAFTALGVSDPEDMVRQIASGEITEDTSFKYTDDFARAINTGGDIAGEAQKLRDAGKENDTIKSAITSLYKDQYAELLNSDPQEAADLKDRLVQAFVAAGDTEEKASKKIDNWITGPQLETARENFTNAIESGGNLSAGVNALHDLGQDDGAIRNFITSEYKQKYTDLYEQNQTEASKLKKQLVNAFMAAGDSREDAEGKIDNWITGPKVAEAKGNMFTAINDGGNITGQVDELRKLGKDDSTIKSYITSEYKPQYIELYNTNRSAALELQNKLIRAYMAAGDTHEQALKKINKWVE